MIGKSHYAMAQQVEHYRTETILPLAAAAEGLADDPYVIYDGSAENIPDSLFGKFDLVVSITAFEHILTPSLVLRKAHACLAEGGRFFSYHGPVWSSYCGHHVWVRPDLNFNALGCLPDFVHLLMRPAEVFELVCRHHPTDIADQVVEQMFFSSRINRMYYSDHEAFVACSPFREVLCQPYASRPVPADLLTRLQALHPRAGDFSAYGVQVTATR
jgi:hypothetical protein